MILKVTHRKTNISGISNNMLNSRRKYDTSFRQKVMSMVDPLLVCKTKRQKKRAKQHQNAEERFHEELDCVQIIKSIRELKVLTKIILSQHQRQLLSFHKNNVISYRNFEKEEEAQLEHWMPFEDTAKLKSFIYKVKVADIMKGWKDSQITEIDKKLMGEIIAKGEEESSNDQTSKGKQ